jgi:hypothetical protein
MDKTFKTKPSLNWPQSPLDRALCCACKQHNTCSVLYRLWCCKPSSMDRVILSSLLQLLLIASFERRHFGSCTIPPDRFIQRAIINEESAPSPFRGVIYQGDLLLPGIYLHRGIQYISSLKDYVFSNMIAQSVWCFALEARDPGFKSWD